MIYPNQKHIRELYERYYSLAKLTPHRVITRNVNIHEHTINRKGTTSRWFLNSGRQRANMSGNICKKKLQFRILVVEEDIIKMGLSAHRNPESQNSQITRGAEEGQE